MAKATAIRILLRRPRNDSLGTVSGRGCAAPAAVARRHEEIAFWLYCFATPSDEPPLAANIGGHSMGKMLGETFMRPMQLASLSGILSHLLRRSSPPMPFAAQWV